MHTAPDRVSTPQHAYRVATTRISVTSTKGTIGSPGTQRARTEPTPELKSETRINPNKDPLLGHRPNDKTRFSGTEAPELPASLQEPAGYLTTRYEESGGPGRKIRDDDREGAGTFRHACFIRMSCRGLYLNPGYQPSAHRIPTRLPEELDPSRGEARPGIGLDDKYEHAPACSEGPAIPTDYRE